MGSALTPEPSTEQGAAGDRVNPQSKHRVSTLQGGCSLTVLLCRHPNPTEICFPRSQVTAAVTPWLCRTEPLLRHKAAQSGPGNLTQRQRGREGLHFSNLHFSNLLTLGVLWVSPRRQSPAQSSAAGACPWSPASARAEGQVQGGEGLRHRAWALSCSPSTAAAPSPPLPGSHPGHKGFFLGRKTDLQLFLFVNDPILKKEEQPQRQYHIKSLLKRANTSMSPRLQPTGYLC